MVSELIYTQHTKSLVHHCIINPKPVHCQQLFELLAYSRQPVEVSKHRSDVLALPCSRDHILG